MFWTYDKYSVNEMWIHALGDLASCGTIQPGRDQRTKELLHVLFHLRNPRNRYLLARPISIPFALAEVIWILSGRKDVESIAWWNPRLRDYSDDGVEFHGACGARLRNDNLNTFAYRKGVPIQLRDQLGALFGALSNNPDRRDVVLQIWNASLDMPYDKQPRSKDVPCNLVSHPLIRDGKLEWTQVMRSTDAFWGWPYNMIQWTMLQEIVAGWLGIEVGPFVLISDSFHVYKRHWDDIYKALGRPLPGNSTLLENPDDLRLPIVECNGALSVIEDIAFRRLPKMGNNWKQVETCIENTGLPKGYKNIAKVLMAETFRKYGMLDMALEVNQGNSNPVLRQSFVQWFEYAQSKETT